jgi:hypothetical protein
MRLSREWSTGPLLRSVLPSEMIESAWAGFDAVADRGHESHETHSDYEPVSTALTRSVNQGRRKFMVTVEIMGTATPLSRVGLYSHCLTASIAASSRSETDRRILTSVTRPSGSMRTARITTPVTPSARASAGCTGHSWALRDSGCSECRGVTSGQPRIPASGLRGCAQVCSQPARLGLHRSEGRHIAGLPRVVGRPRRRGVTPSSCQRESAPGAIHRVFEAQDAKHEAHCHNTGPSRRLLDVPEGHSGHAHCRSS